MLGRESAARNVSLCGMITSLTRPRALIILIFLIAAVALMKVIIHNKGHLLNSVLSDAKTEDSSAVQRNVTPKSAPSRTKCQVVDLRKPNNEKNECVTTKTKPPYKVCIYDTNKDKIVSLYLKNTGFWEQAYISTFQAILNRDKGLGFLDFGANIAPYGLLAAAMGHKTVAVEPYTPHIKLIHKSVKVNKFEDSFVLVQNAISDKYANFTAYFAYGKSNQGSLRMTPFKGQGIKMSSVLMDDLLDVITFNRALLKIDVEGFEDKALAKSDKFFEKIFIPYILMEWAFPLYVDKNNPKKVMGLINMVQAKGYKPFTYGMAPLDINKWRTWPNDLIWKHNLVGKI